MSCALRYLGVATRRAILSGDEPAWLLAHPRRSYVRQGYLSCPEWVDRTEMRWIDWCRRSWSKATGVEHVLDHIQPLNHPRVNGLTVPWNFRLVPRMTNATKGNTWCDTQGEIFGDRA
jgi:hypothetical protein